MKVEPMICTDVLIKHDFLSFTQQCFATLNPSEPFVPSWHIALIADYLEACRNGQVKRLIINVPPRSLKSVCVSVAWPAWLMGHNPAARILTASYARALSTKHSLDCRTIMQSDWYGDLFPETVLRDDQNEKHKFVTTQHGMRLATSIWGSVTGEGGNVLIADDPLNPMQAGRARMRGYVNDWFEHSFASRLDNKRKGCMVVVMQRLHAEDLSGHLLHKGGWEKLVLPAIAMQDETWQVNGSIYRRKQGDLLHPAREDAALIERAKQELGSLNFAAQYQQSPVIQEGGMLSLSWFGRF